MKPPVSYYGGKVRLAPWIVSLLPSHRVYIEPFCGSCAVLLAKPRSTHELVNDLDSDVVTFFRVLRDRPGELARACRLTPYARAEFDAADLAATALDEVERARRWWVRATGSINRNVTAHRSFSVSTKRGSSEARSTLSLVERFEAVAARLRTVVIECRPAVEVIAAHAGADAVVYADPPYVADARSASGAYRREYASEAQHRQLAVALHATPAAVVLSGYPSALYDQLYAGWWRAERRVHRPSTNTGGRGGRAAAWAVEVVWSNRPLPGQQRLRLEEATSW